jgi:hypothetical protein
VPLPSRDLTAGAIVRAGLSTSHLRDRALDVLLDPALEHVVDLVCWSENGQVHVADARGHVALATDGGPTLLAGRDPIADQDPFSDDTHAYPFAGPAAALAVPRGARARPRGRAHRRAPLAGERRPPRRARLAQRHPVAAPLVLSGPGVRERGVVERVARTVDVGATPGSAVRRRHLRHGGGRRSTWSSRARAHVVGLLWDGAQCADLLAQVEAAHCRTSRACSPAAAPCAAGRSPSSRASRW